jgi:hypothetical protein
MFPQDPLAVRLALYELNGLESTQPASGKAEATDATEQIQHAKSGHRPTSPYAAHSLANCGPISSASGRHRAQPPSDQWTQLWQEAIGW